MDKPPLGGHVRSYIDDDGKPPREGISAIFDSPTPSGVRAANGFTERLRGLSQTFRRAVERSGPLLLEIAPGPGVDLQPEPVIGGSTDLDEVPARSARGECTGEDSSARAPLTSPVKGQSRGRQDSRWNW